MLKVLSKTLLVVIILCSWLPEAFGQPVLPYDLKKPKKYENKLLGAEKGADKKLTNTRRFVQNTVTHYNWYFNANNKLNEVLERAKLANKDDYTQLLPFYNYSLDKTSADKTELDSVVYKANAGVLNHDLRNSWIDNLYLLMGRAYYLRNDLDSAYMTFQYINYAFSPKDDGYDLPIGSNSNEGGSALSVSTKENNTLVRRMMSTPPSRNESFVWQIKTYLAKDAMAQAASLIQTLKNDPVFPDRLRTDLNEVQSLYFYKQKIYDSAAIYLEGSLDNAANRQETARWEYLIAQLYELNKDHDHAREFYEKAVKLTLDPVLEVYGILNSIRQNASDSNAIKKNIAELQKMGKRDKYVKYRDIVYYTAAQIELERNNVPGAKQMLLKSTAASTSNLNPIQRTRSFLLLGDISFNEREYGEAKRYYDSINNNDPGIPNTTEFEKRKDILQDLVLQMDVLHRQDSLQQLAAMPAPQREAILKKMVRQFRKRQGLKEEESTTGNAAVGMDNANKAAPELFENDTKGDWYFNNPSLKSKGFTSFKQVWGNRPNVDNWRRQASIAESAAAKENNGNPAEGDSADQSQLNPAAIYQVLLKNIPLTPQQQEKSEDSVQNAMLNMGIIFVEKLEEYPIAIDTLEHFVNQYPYSTRMPEALYYLYYAYRKTGKNEKAAAIEQEMNQKFAGTKFQKQVHNAATGEGDKAKQQITKDYEKIYTLFIEGDFEKALAQKKINDSLYGTLYWTPQLLYIESVYYIHNKKDDEARKELQSIIDVYPDDPMAVKAKTFLEVLGRRKEIEDYLTKLEIKRIEDTVTVVNAPPKQGEMIGTPLKQDTARMLAKKMSLADSLKLKFPPPMAKKDSAKAEVASAYTFNVEAPHAVVVVLSRVDPVYVTESKNAFNRYNLEKFYNKPITINNQSVNDTLKLVVMTGFENAAVALDYLQKTTLVAATRIVPWLPATKYSFLVISEANLEVLKNKQDLTEYQKFEQRYFKAN
ncbi:MAG: hypothetical protein ABI415_09175 [Flavitalea sp.]